MRGNAPLVEHLALSVPMRIDEFAKRGGPTEDDFERISGYTLDLGERGDVLLYGEKSGEPAELANKVADALAVMAFVPGGVEAFGMCFVAYEDELLSGRRAANRPVAVTRGMNQRRSP